MGKKTIAFIPGSFRPFGEHHLRMVKHYADICDEVNLVISSPKSSESQRLTNLGEDITSDDAKAIIDMCLQDCGCENCKCEISQDPNPIQTILKDIGNLRDCVIILGVGNKDDDSSRFNDIDLNYFKDNNVEITPPSETVYNPDEETCFVSASDIREHIDDKDMLRSYLPVSIEPETFEKIYGILNGDHVLPPETPEEIAKDSSIFQNLLQENIVDEDDDEDSSVMSIDEEETEFSNLKMDDATLESADCKIIAYNTQIRENDDDPKAYTPKTNPDKAVDIVFYFNNGNKIEVYLDTKSKEWCSCVNDRGVLSPDQMGEFFGTDLSKRIDDRLCQMWPESDPFFNGLVKAVKNKKICVEPIGVVSEDGEFRKGNIDINKSRNKNAAGKQIYTRSGRKIVSFSDFGVKHTDEEAYYVWPEKNKEFKWSQWADWTKAKLLCRCRFTHNSYTYGLSLSMFPDDNKNRGFRSYNLDLEPKLQYCTPEETQQMMELSLVQRFLRNALKRLNRFMSLSDDEIFEKVNSPERCTLDDIRRTKHVIKNTMKAIREKRVDTYIYT